MRFYVFESGSKGNCSLIESHGQAIIIDMGISLKKLKEKLKDTDFELKDISAFLFTHNHGDHIGGLCTAIPINKCFCSLDTLRVPEKNILDFYQTYQIGPFAITVLPTSHDAKNSIGFVLDDGEEKMVYMTDTGYISDKNISYMENANYYIIESNYNYLMLLQSHRTQQLKLRIAGDFGHLSNDDSAEVISHIIGPNTTEIVLAHISQETNTHEVALDTYQKVFFRNKVSLNNIRLVCADQVETVAGGDIKVAVSE